MKWFICDNLNFTFTYVLWTSLGKAHYYSFYILFMHIHNFMPLKIQSNKKGFSTSLNICFKLYLYIRNLKYAHLTPVFRQDNIHLVLSTFCHKYKWILCTEKPVSNASFQDFWCTNMNIHLICFENLQWRTFYELSLIIFCCSLEC